MIELSTNCDVCIHKKVCKNVGNAKHAMEKLKGTIYSSHPNMDYPWETIMADQDVRITFSCDAFSHTPMNR